jgi:DNA-binding response OmpR family regulator
MEGQRRRVLVIEDDPKFGSFIGRVLAPPHDVLVLTRAQEALGRIARGERFDLILCDLMLPGVSAVGFHEQLGLIAPELVGNVVVVTGGAYSQESEAFLKRADIRRIEKPFPSLGAFRAMVHEHLRRVCGEGGQS